MHPLGACTQTLPEALARIRQPRVIAVQSLSAQEGLAVFSRTPSSGDYPEPPGNEPAHNRAYLMWEET